MEHGWDFAFLLEQRDFILRGLMGTLRLAATCVVAGVVLGLLFASAQLSRFAPLRLLGVAYVEFFRNIPVLVQIFWCYFTLPILTGMQPNAFSAAAVAISLYAGAYLAEIFRSGIQSIERGQWEAARAIGFGHLALMRWVVLPQAVRAVVPPLTNQVMEIVKTTTVASTIAYGEILYSAKVLSDQEFRPIESYTAVGIFFIVTLTFVSLLSSWLERRLRRHV
ncbi:amino acid ABC transporter permease [Roseomonas terrae]|jgi:polar amino acid transport system permease protein|uniref:Amino acid ABC transporter permease n=1 Tax=Neoroseomonas terrae TaxID=424799 RepID=A0ABS5ERB4_9PROT|nr:amino acid ABC transporter permease [Neoroseomonas terrae]MBR0653202.1 amino acid ABC transporter permease [Neoroseomonas terrae]